jgi:hypothetical protein
MRVVLKTLFFSGIVRLGEHYDDGWSGRRAGLLEDHAPDVGDGVGGWALWVISFALCDVSASRKEANIPAWRYTASHSRPAYTSAL